MQIKAGMSLDSKTEPRSSDPMVNGKIPVRIDLQAKLIAKLSQGNVVAVTITTTTEAEVVEERVAAEVAVEEGDDLFSSIWCYLLNFTL